jgi:hypothetical protein
MNIKQRLTIAMFALPMSFMMVTMGSTPYIVLTGAVLMLIHMVLWVNLLSEIEEKKK